MKKCLLSVDWDYFVYTQKENWGSYIENNRNVINLWYKRYIQCRNRGKSIEKSFELSKNANIFWNKIKRNFKFDKNLKVYISDSHVLSYDIAKKYDCNEVYLFDAHSDLGYGGLSSLNFEVNCANWLGKLLKNNIINKANIIYSPYTTEKPEYFKEIKNKYNVNFIDIDDLEKDIYVPSLHICRSGAWTPPWFDEDFKKFIDELKVPYKIVDCPKRNWSPENLSFSDAIYYLM
ncbi:arginase [Clostridium senegalense]|uniref:Arginase n=1 Tax=Clostridium senegalense TaxID=1465809 RepID=A0A6M0H7S6_9CLOT|nr:arginase [Clostridium senegalense]NEU05901.1 arginase [Clostridium senegalense]